MGGRSATSGIETFGRKMGTRLSPKQYKEAMSDSVDAVIAEMTKRTPAMQKIIRKDFRGNEAHVSLELRVGGQAERAVISQSVDEAIEIYGDRAKEQQKKKKSVNTWSAYDVSRAKLQVYQEMLKELQKLKKKLSI